MLLGSSTGFYPWGFLVAIMAGSIAIVVLQGRHLHSGWSRRAILRAFRRMDALDAREAPESDYEEPLSDLTRGLPAWAAAMAVERLADGQSPSRRRHLEILRSSDLSDLRGRLIAIARDAADPLAPDVWSLLTSRPASGWKKALLAADEGADFAPAAPPRSGTWVGFYRQMGAEHRMDLSLDFEGTAIHGEGFDVVGPFRLEGEILGQAVRLWKSYATHPVEYVGELYEDSIGGRWTLAMGSGEFRIWPIRRTLGTSPDSAAAAFP